MKAVTFILTHILFTCNILTMWGYPGTHRGDKILTNFGIDSIVVDSEIRYYNLDSLLFLIMTEGYTPRVQNINVRYFVDIVDYMPYQKQLEQTEKFRIAAKKYHSKQLAYEADFVDIWNFPAPNDSLFQVKVAMMDNFVSKMHKEKEYEFEIRGREFICNLYLERDEFARPFREFPHIDRLLDRISDVNKSGVNSASKKKFYYWFGQMYYKFRDYDKAVYYYKKAMVEPSEYLYTPYHLYDEGNLRARNALGLYYAQIGDLQTSDSYFRSMLVSPDSVKRRDLCDALALCNLGQNELKRGHYDETVKLIEKGLPVLLHYDYYPQAAEASIALGEAWLAKNNISEVQKAINTARNYINLAGDDDHCSRLFQLMSKYYGIKGNNKLSATYLDSTIIAKENLEKKYNALIILRAEQETFEAEKAAAKEEFRLHKENARNVLISALVIILLCVVALIVFITLYRKKKAAYRELVRYNQQWAHVSVEENGMQNGEDIGDAEYETHAGEQSSNDNYDLICRLQKIFETEKLYKDTRISLEGLARKLDVNRVILSQAINRVTRKNFNLFINEYRVKEAIKIMSDRKSDNLTIDAIAFDAGFNDRRTFYRVFKKITGLSPSDFRKNIPEK